MRTGAVKRASWLLPIAAGLGALFIFVGWTCPIRAVVGQPCPTCGMTRALRLAVRGDVAGATRLHPLVWIVVPFVGAWLAIELAGFVRTGAWGASARVRHGTTALVTIASLLFALWIARFCGALGGPVP